MEKDTSIRGLGWSGRLGMVDTIFEEEEYNKDLNSSISSPSSPDLLSGVDTWSHVTGKNPDVKIYVQGECFWLHKEVLTCKSGYLKRKLEKVSVSVPVSELNLSPPLKICPSAFKLFAEFSYQCDVVLTPFNIAALLTAIELLQLHRETDEEDLRHRAASYFSAVVAAKADLSAAVFMSSLCLLPESEDLARVPSRCLESMYSIDGILGCVECVKTVQPVEFQVIVDSLRRRSDRGHDFLYRIIDLYIKVYEGKISDEQKTKISSTVDCNRLSPQLLMHGVQNPRMPIRFIVQAMLIEQLNARHSILNPNLGLNPEDSAEVATLGALLQRDAALRQVRQLREAMETTTTHIQSLEKEVSHMKARLIESEKQGSNNSNACGRSVSCRFTRRECNKVEKGERNSVSSGSLCYKALASDEEGGLRDENGGGLRTKKSIKHWLMRGLRSAFRVSSYGGNNEGKERNEVVVVDEDQAQRRHSLS